VRELSFDGLVGPTHNYGGLAVGNVASSLHEGRASSPRTAALQGLAKMRALSRLGVAQAVLPPHPRPSITTLRRLGFGGTDEQVISSAAREDELLVRMCSSAAAMWVANAATVAPSTDAQDGRVHLVVANLDAMFHRSIEAPTTEAVLRAIFADPRRFAVHPALPGARHFGDEGAANHTRLMPRDQRAVHLLAWGRKSSGAAPSPSRYPARQAFEASQAVARLLAVDPERCLFPQQHPDGIDAGAFHTDVLAVGNDDFLMMHELAFSELPSLLSRLRALCGEALTIEIATTRELPIQDAITAYPFNSQLVTLPDGAMAIVAPADARESASAHAFLERVVAADNPVRELHYLDVRESMRNGGGPACLRLRVPLEPEEISALSARVLFTDDLDAEIVAWVERHYRERLLPADLCDPALARETMTALDELTRILQLGSVYDFQRP
jgi:succinylarginine dihydrolase